MVDRRIHVVDDLDREDGREELLRPVGLGSGHGVSEDLAGRRAAADLDAGFVEVLQDAR